MLLILPNGFIFFVLRYLRRDISECPRGNLKMQLNSRVQGPRAVRILLRYLQNPWDNINQLTN